MSSMAKTAREAMKAKAKRLGSDRQLEKVDSSSWTPPEMLNADVKTGMRPISKPKFKKGGKVSGATGVKHAGRKARKSGGRALTADSLINRDVKEANELREGKKHIGALKRGGKAMRKGRDDGGKVDEIAEFLKKDDMPFPKAEPRGPSDNTPDVTPAWAARMRNVGNMKPPARKSGGRSGKAGGGMLEAAKRAMMIAKDPHRKGTGPAPLTEQDKRDATLRDQADTLRKYGAPRKTGGKTGHPDEKADKALIRKMVKASARTGKAGGGSSDDEIAQYRKDMDDYRKKHAEWYHGPYDKNKKAPQQPESPAMKRAFTQIEETFSPERMRQMAMKQHDARMKDPAFVAGRVKRGMDPDVNPYEDKSKTLAQIKRADDDAEEKGYIASQMADKDRTGRKAGGGVFSGSGYPNKVPGDIGGRQARATGGKARGKGKTNINIVIAAGKTPGADAGILPPGGMPKPPGGVPIPLPPQGGAPQGGAPMPMPVPMPMPPQGAGGPPGMPPMGRKSGGRISKVARSYKDMEAGAGSGEGRLQKTDIAKRTNHKAGGKVYRSYKDMDAGAGSGFGRLEKTEIAKHKK